MSMVDFVEISQVLPSPVPWHQLGAYGLTSLAYGIKNLSSCFRTYIGNPVHYDAKMTCDELAGKVRTRFQLIPIL